MAELPLPGGEFNACRNPPTDSYVPDPMLDMCSCARGSLQGPCTKRLGPWRASAGLGTSDGNGSITSAQYGLKLKIKTQSGVKLLLMDIKGCKGVISLSMIWWFCCLWFRKAKWIVTVVIGKGGKWIRLEEVIVLPAIVIAIPFFGRTKWIWISRWLCSLRSIHERRRRWRWWRGHERWWSRSCRLFAGDIHLMLDICPTALGRWRINFWSIIKQARIIELYSLGRFSSLLGL